MNIGTNLANIRKKRNLTQEELASLINVSPKTISSYETNRSLPNIEILITLSSVLDTNIETILNLNKENKEEIKRIYTKKTLKNDILKTLFISLIFIIPLIFFTYSGYTSISAFAAGIISGTNSLDEIAKTTYNLFLSFTYEYLIYTIFMLINYLLYKKKHLKTLFIINTIFLIIILIDLLSIFNNFYEYDILIFLISPIFGLILAYKLFKEKN